MAAAPDLYPPHMIPDGIRAEEWAVRCDLAAAYRLCALYGWTDLNNTHISARVPGTEDEFLLNPFGLFFEEITASSLIRVDRHSNVTGGSEYGMNKAGFVIHGAIHLSHPHLHYVMHTHSRYGVAVSMQKQGLLPSSQKALTILGWVGYHDFEGTATEAGERPRIVRDLGDRRLLVLRNHGLLSVGETMGEAFVWILPAGDRLPSPDRRTRGRSGAATRLARDAGADDSSKDSGCTGAVASSRPARSGRLCCVSSNGRGWTITASDGRRSRYYCA